MELEPFKKYRKEDKTLNLLNILVVNISQKVNYTQKVSCDEGTSKNED